LTKEEEMSYKVLVIFALAVCFSAGLCENSNGREENLQENRIALAHPLTKNTPQKEPHGMKDNHMIKIGNFKVLEQPELYLWLSTTTHKINRCSLNGKKLERYRTFPEQWVPTTLAPVFDGIVMKPEEIFLNSLIKAGSKYDFSIEFAMPEPIMDSYVGMVAAIYGHYGQEQSNYDHDIFTEGLQYPEEKDKAEIIKTLQDGKKNVKPIGLSYWFGGDRNITPKDCNLHIYLDGSDPRLKYKTIPIRDFKFSLDNNYFPGSFMVNGIELARFDSARPKNKEAVIEGGSFTLVPWDWAKFLQKGKNTLTYKIYEGKNYIPHENDYLVVKLIPYEYDGHFHYFDTVLFREKISPKDTNWKLDLDITEFPERCWENPDVYQPDLHQKLVIAQVNSLLQSIKKRDQESFINNLGEFTKEKSIYMPVSTAPIEGFLNFYEKEHPGFKVELITEKDIKIKTYFNNKLIQVSSREFDSLYYGFTDVEKGKKKFFKFSPLPEFLIIQDGKPKFCL
jgi:hypothetical protein